jgi:hypothetical protein
MSETWNVVQHVETDLAEETKNGINSIGDKINHLVQQTEEKVVDFSNRLDEKTKEALAVTTYKKLNYERNIFRSLPTKS